MDAIRIGLDLAKNVFSLHGVDANGKVVLRRTVSRAKLVEVLANTPPRLIGMEARSGAHHWARVLCKFGHDVRIMAAQFVAPYRKDGKNDGNDAAAICEAVSRPGMRSYRSNRLNSRPFWCFTASARAWVTSAPR